MRVKSVKTTELKNLYNNGDYILIRNVEFVLISIEIPHS